MMSVIIGGGTASATYAWYQLAADKEIQISGTSFGESANLQIGFISPVSLSYKGLTYSTTDSALEGKSIYWCSDTNASADMVSYILKSNGYSTGDVYPLTTGKFAQGDAFNLYQAPGYTCEFDRIHPAALSAMYLHLDFAFKVGDSNSIVNGAKIYFNDYQIKGNAKEALRVHVSSSSLADTLIKPYNSVAGVTQVGGPLDLDRDGKYDYLYDSASNANKEFFYGQSDSAPVYGSPYLENAQTVDKNYDCFANPNHDKGTMPLEQVSSYASTAAYSSINSFIYKGDEENNSSVTPLAVTDTNGIAILNFDIYMEGWDKDLIDETIGTTIGTAIQFIVGKIN